MDEPGIRPGHDAAGHRRALDLSLADPGGRLLFRGATIVSMDADVGDFVTGDLLVEDGKITAVGADLEPPVPTGRRSSSTPPGR